MSRRFKIILALAAFVIVAIAAVAPAIFTVRAPITSLRIDTSTPAAQKGFKAIDVSTIDSNGQTTCHWPDTTPYLLRLFRKWRGIPSTGPTDTAFAYDARGGIALWVSPSWLPKGTQGASVPKSSYTCSGRSSSGSEVPMGWEEEVTGNNKIMLLLWFPQGYPNTFRYIDVNLKDAVGHSARWRVTGLPKTNHLVPPGTPEQRQFRFAGMTLRAQAWKQSAQELEVSGIGSKYVYATQSWVEGKVTLPGNWDLEQHTAELEWWPAGIPVSNNGYSTTTISMGRGSNGFSGTSGTGDRLLYPDDTHWIRIPFVIHQFVYLDEAVTFHNLPVQKIGARYRVWLPKTLSYTTPTGLTVRLLDRKSATAEHDSYGQDKSIFCQLDVAVSVMPNQLPRSPLVKKYRNPLLIQLEGARPPFQIGSWNTSNSVHDIRMSTKEPIGKTIPALSFIIRQRYNLQTLPAALTIPIEAKRPSNNR